MTKDEFLKLSPYEKYKIIGALIKKGEFDSARFQKIKEWLEDDLGIEDENLTYWNEVAEKEGLK